MRSVSPTAKEALKFIYSCKTTDQMSALPTCIFCSEVSFIFQIKNSEYDSPFYFGNVFIQGMAQNKQYLQKDKKRHLKMSLFSILLFRRNSCTVIDFLCAS